MVGCLIFIAGLVTGGGIAVILLSCLQINRIDKYESNTNKFRTEDNKNIPASLQTNIGDNTKL